MHRNSVHLILLVVFIIGVSAQIIDAQEITDYRPEAVELYDEAIIAYWTNEPYYSNHTRALELLTHAIDLEPNFAEAYAYRSTIHYLLENSSQSSIDIDFALAFDPDNAIVLMHSALYETRLGNRELAFDYIEQAIANSPNESATYFMRSQIYWHFDRKDDALDEIAYAIEIDESPWSRYYTKYGQYLAQLDYYQNAEVMYLQAHDINPNDIVPLVELSEIHFKFQNFGQASFFAEKALELAPNDPLVRITMGRALQQAPTLNESTEQFEIALELDPTLPNIYKNLGYNYREMGDYQTAITYYDQAIELAPNDADAYYGRGTVHNFSDWHHEAIKDLTTAITLEPTFHQAYINRAWAYRQGFQNELAIADYQSAIEIWDEFWFAYRLLGDTYNDVYEYENAIVAYEEAIRLNNGYLEAYVGLGEAFFHLERYEDVIENFNFLISLNPDVVQSYYYLGLAYLELGDEETSDAYFDYYNSLVLPD